MKDTLQRSEGKEKRPSGQPVKVVDRRSRGLRQAAGDPSGSAAEEPGAGQGASQRPRYPSYVEELQARTERAELRVNEVLEAHRKIRSEQEQFRERLRRDVQRRVDTEVGQALEAFIEVLDDMDRALGHASEAASRTESPELAALLDGLRLVRERYLAALENRGVERLDLSGKPFDPELAEAVQAVDVDDPEKNGIVLEEILAGYTYRDRPLRPAKVRVGRLK